MPSFVWQTYSFDVQVSGAPESDIDMLVFEPSLSRVRIDVSATDPPTGSQILIERSIDQRSWTTVRGGDKADIPAGSAPVDDYEFTPGATNYYRVTPYSGPSPLHTYTDSITPPDFGRTEVWLKSLTFPFLNQTVMVTDVGDITQPSRSSTFDVIGRVAPVAVSDVRGARQCDIQVASFTALDGVQLRGIMAWGDVVYLQAAETSGVPTMYASVGDTSEKQTPGTANRYTKILTLPLTEAAAPDPGLVGATATCRTLTRLYQTCADLAAAVPTCADVMELRGTADDITP